MKLFLLGFVFLSFGLFHLSSSQPERAKIKSIEETAYQIDYDQYVENEEIVIQKQISNKTLFKYNKSGKRSSQTFYLPNKKRRQVQFTYDKKGLLVQRRWELKKRNRRSNLIKAIEYQYDDKQRLITELFSSTEKEKENYSYHYKYDADNRVIVEEKTDKENTRRLKEYKYDSKGNRIEEVYIWYPDTIKDIWTYTYNQSGQMITQEEHSPEDTFIFKDSFVYLNENLIKEIAVLENGNIAAISEYKYNDYHDLSETTHTRDGEPTPYYRRQEIYKYDAKKNWIQRIQLSYSKHNNIPRKKADITYREIKYFKK